MSPKMQKKKTFNSIKIENEEMEKSKKQIKKKRNIYKAIFFKWNDNERRKLPYISTELDECVKFTPFQRCELFQMKDILKKKKVYHTQFRNRSIRYCSFFQCA